MNYRSLRTPSVKRSYATRDSTGTMARHTRLILGGGGALVLALLAGTVMAGLFTPQRAAAQSLKFTQRETTDQVYNVQQSMERCDKESLRKGIDGLKRTKTVLDGAAKSGFVEGAKDDA